MLAAGLAGTIAGSAVYPFLGVWALRELGASQVELSVALLAGALCGGAARLFLAATAMACVGHDAEVEPAAQPA